MTAKCALIVDDSRSARVVLQRMLSAHNLSVDMAESAEAALDYLSEHRPDVIFMDHMMPGMDGFEAVQAIKNNPATATIPIMMYTSQEGELYVGQARALGAVGVLPKHIEPVEVSRVLKSLRLIPGISSESLPSEDQSEQSLSDTARLATLPAADHDLRGLIQSMFEQQRAVLRRDLLDSYEAIAARVAEEISPEIDSAEDEDSRERPLSGATVLVLASLAVATTAFAFLYWQAETRWQQEREARAELTSQLSERQQLNVDGTLEMQESLRASREQLDSSYGAMLDALQWAFNNGRRYAWNDIPLSDGFAQELDGLATRLGATGFSGTILVETHVGEFCFEQGASGELIVADDTLPFAACIQVGQTVAEADRIGSQQSVAFANLAQTISERTQGNITIVTSTLANTAPVGSYPPLTDTLTAGDWNQVARASHRIVVTIESF